MAATDISAEELRELLHYDQLTGLLSWKGALPKSRRHSGDIAGHAEKTGRIVIRVKGRLYLAHRLAWLHVTGHWPQGVIDHRDGNPGNNRWENLRDASITTNQQNQRRAQRRSVSGLLGVITRPDGKFSSQISVKGTQKYLGRFATAMEAHVAYLNAKRRLHDGCTI